MELAMSYNLIRKDEKLLLNAADKLDIRLKPLRIKDMALDLSRNGPEIDAVLDRGMGQFQSEFLINYLDSKGIFTLNKPGVIRNCGDKALTSLRLAEAGVPTPRSAVAFDSDEAISIIEDIGYPAVIKPVIGSWGRLVSKIDTRSAAEAVLEHREVLGGFQHSVTYIQEFIEKSGCDIRAFVVGDETICAISRESEHWITNTARGGSVSNHPVNDDLHDICQRSSEAVGGGILAIDLFETGSGYLVNEINHTMEFKNSIEPTGVDIPSRVVSYFHEVARR